MGTEKRERIEYIDLFKSFGIILMILGHISFGDGFNKLIHAFHMPMFFWISGYLCGKYGKSEMPFKVFLKKKAKALLIPYASIGILYYLAQTAIRIITHQGLDLWYLHSITYDNSAYLGLAGPIWFLTALFSCEVIFYFINRYFKKQSEMVIVVVSVPLIELLSEGLGFTLPLSIGVGCMAVVIFYLGYLFAKYNTNKVIHFFSNLGWILNTLLGAITGVLIFLNDEINMKTATFGIVPLFYLNALLGTIVLFNYARLLYPFIANNVVGRYLCEIGRESIVYLCLNLIVLYPLRKILLLLPIPLYFEKVLEVIFALAILWVLTKIIQKTKLRYLFGKF